MTWKNNGFWAFKYRSICAQWFKTCRVQLSVFDACLSDFSCKQVNLGFTVLVAVPFQHFFFDLPLLKSFYFFYSKADILFWKEILIEWFFSSVFRAAEVIIRISFGMNVYLFIYIFFFFFCLLFIEWQFEAFVLKTIQEFSIVSDSIRNKYGIFWQYATLNNLPRVYWAVVLVILQYMNVSSFFVNHLKL